MTKGAFRLPLYNGGSNPDPAVYCPVYGYVRPGEYATDPENYPVADPESNEISLLVSDELYRKICFKCTVQDSTQYTVKVYGLAGEISSTNVNSNSNYTYNIPLGEGAENSQGFTTYLISIKPTMAGKNLLSFAVQSITGYTTDWQIIEARFNCANMTSLDSAFSNTKRLEYCKFIGSMNSLLGMSSTFSYCDGLIKIDWPTSLTSLLSLQGIFYNAKCKMKVVFPNLPALTNCLYAFYQSNLTHIEFVGASNSLSNMNRIAQLAIFLKKIIFPSSVSALNTLYQAFAGCTSLYEIVLPEGNMGSSSPISFTNWLNGVVLGKLTNTPTWTTALNNLQDFTYLYDMTSFNHPTLRVNQISIVGTSTRVSPLNYVEIDWANSFSDTGTGRGVTLQYLSLSSSEINRIFTALPTITSVSIIVQNNPGSATCDPTIATAKGWTVYK